MAWCCQAASHYLSQCWSRSNKLEKLHNIPIANPCGPFQIVKCLTTTLVFSVLPASPNCPWQVTQLPVTRVECVLKFCHINNQVIRASHCRVSHTEAPLLDTLCRYGQWVLHVCFRYTWHINWLARKLVIEDSPGIIWNKCHLIIKDQIA